MSKICVSVITVCLNSEKEISRTIKSVLEQDYDDFEYIIKEGISTDNTGNVIKEECGKFPQKKDKVKYFKTDDNGIYDAMNQAVEKAKGEWVIFMNAGDSFFNKYVLKDVFCNKQYNTNISILYGHAVYELEGKISLISCFDLEFLQNEVCYCHQSIFARRNLFDKYMFSLDYRILGDYEWLLHIKISGEVFQALNIIVCKFRRNGISAKCMRISSDEEIKIRESFNLYNNINRTKIECIIKDNVRKKLPLLADLSFCYKQMKRITKYLGDL